MTAASEREEKRRLEEKTIKDKLEETFRTNGWKDVLMPMFEEIFCNCLDDSSKDTEEGRKARYKMEAVKFVLEKIGVKINAGEKAKEFLNKKLKGE